MISLKRRFYYALLFGIIFSILFFTVARLPRYTSLNASTSLDSSIPLIPFFIIFYLTDYIFPLAAFLAAETNKGLKAIFKTFVIQLLISSIIFLAIPVAIQHQPILSTDIFSRILIFVREIIDNQWNAFPSHHVATAFLTFLIISDKSKKLSIPVFIIAFLIIISTLLTKQHVIIDVLAGLILATGFYFYYIHIIKKI